MGTFVLFLGTHVKCSCPPIRTETPIPCEAPDFSPDIAHEFGGHAIYHEFGYRTIHHEFGAAELERISAC